MEFESSTGIPERLLASLLVAECTLLSVTSIQWKRLAYSWPVYSSLVMVSSPRSSCVGCKCEGGVGVDVNSPCPTSSLDCKCVGVDLLRVASCEIELVLDPSARSAGSILSSDAILAVKFIGEGRSECNATQLISSVNRTCRR